MEADTSLELSAGLPDIAEHPEDTPQSVGQGRQAALRSPIVLALASLMMTPMLTSADPLATSNDMTGFAEEERLATPFTAPFDAASIPEQVSTDVQAEAYNRTRLALLARQYAKRDLSPEEEARLMIVTERVRRLMPRVTVEDFEMLERMLEDVQQIETSDMERRRRLGIA